MCAKISIVFIRSPSSWTKFFSNKCWFHGLSETKPVSPRIHKTKHCNRRNEIGVPGRHTIRQIPSPIRYCWLWQKTCIKVASSDNWANQTRKGVGDRDSRHSPIPCCIRASNCRWRNTNDEDTDHELIKALIFFSIYNLKDYFLIVRLHNILTDNVT